MTELLFFLRLLHVVAGVAWLGEVITINFVLLPALFKARGEERVMLLTTVFPYVFRLATVLGGLAVASGVGLLLAYTRLNLALLVQSRWGWFVLVGGTLGGLLYAFHLFQESGAERSLASHLIMATEEGDPEAAVALIRRLAVFPRAGMVILATVIGLMVAAAHLG